MRMYYFLSKSKKNFFRPLNKYQRRNIDCRQIKSTHDEVILLSLWGLCFFYKKKIEAGDWAPLTVITMASYIRTSLFKWYYICILQELNFLSFSLTRNIILQIYSYMNTLWQMCFKSSLENHANILYEFFSEEQTNTWPIFAKLESDKIELFILCMTKLFLHLYSRSTVWIF